MNQEFEPALRMLAHDGERCQLVCREDPMDDYADDTTIVVVAPNGSEYPVARIRTVDEACDFGDDEDLDNARDEENRSLGRLFAAAPGLLAENERLKLQAAQLINEAEQALWWQFTLNEKGWLEGLPRKEFYQHLDSLTRTISQYRGVNETAAEMCGRVFREAAEINSGIDQSNYSAPNNPDAPGQSAQ